MGFFAYVDHRHGVGGVRCVRATSGRVDHLLGVAVVGGDEPASAFFAQGFLDASELGVHGFYGLDGGQ